MSHDIKKGDFIRCKGVGYPHFKEEIFEVTAVFPDNKTIGILSGVRVNAEDFYTVDTSSEQVKAWMRRQIKIFYNGSGSIPSKRMLEVCMSPKEVQSWLYEIMEKHLAMKLQLRVIKTSIDRAISL